MVKIIVEFLTFSAPHAKILRIVEGLQARFLTIFWIYCVRSQKFTF